MFRFPQKKVEVGRCEFCVLPLSGGSSSVFLVPVLPVLLNRRVVVALLHRIRPPLFFWEVLSNARGGCAASFSITPSLPSYLASEHPHQRHPVPIVSPPPSFPPSSNPDTLPTYGSIFQVRLPGKVGPLISRIPGNRAKHFPVCRIPHSFSLS